MNVKIAKCCYFCEYYDRDVEHCSNDDHDTNDFFTCGSFVFMGFIE